MELIQNKTIVITKGQAMDFIFNACRANESRLPKGNVTFKAIGINKHMAYVHDNDGNVIASAIVDEYDN